MKYCRKRTMEPYPLPRTDVCLDTLAGAEWFSTFDLRLVHHQVEMDPRGSDKTTFVTRQGIFRFNIIPFCFCNASATFQRLMNVAMAGLDPMICLVYLDDIIVHSRNLSAHFDRLRLLFDRLLVTGLKLKVSKCRLLRTEVGFLRYRIRAKGLARTPCGCG